MIDPTLETRSERRPIVVLLVDDQKFVSVAVGAMLQSEPDIELHSCLSAVDAIALANRILPTVILQDLMMPDIDGLTLVRAFRLNRPTAATPVIVLSGNDDTETRTRALDAGANGYLVKLPLQADLIASIRRHTVSDTARPGPINRAQPAGIPKMR